MAHLALHNFVHRDLAARNVLLGSGMVCKVADFGLSRQVQTEDNTGDYYRSSSGIIPVRWTAPEGISSQKFSSASDVWSYGITCVEIFQNGDKPYPGINSNPEVIKLVCTQGHVHPRPGCNDAVYSMLVKCWSFEPSQRPEFAALKEFFQQVVEQAPGGHHAGKQAAWPVDNPGYAGNLVANSGDDAYNLTADADADDSDSGAAYDLTADGPSMPQGPGSYNPGFVGNHPAPPPKHVQAPDASENYDLGHQEDGHAGDDCAGQDYDLGHTPTPTPTPTPAAVKAPAVADDDAGDDYLDVSHMPVAATKAKGNTKPRRRKASKGDGAGLLDDDTHETNFGI